MAKAKDPDWEEKAVKRPGALTKKLGGKITEKKLKKAENSKNPLTRKQAVLAETFRKQAARRKKKG